MVVIVVVNEPERGTTNMKLKRNTKNHIISEIPSKLVILSTDPDWSFSDPDRLFFRSVLVFVGLAGF